MTRFLIIFFNFFFTLISTLAYSQDWKLVSSEEGGTEIFIRPHSKNSAWIKQTNTEVYKSILDSEPVKGETIILFRFDCENLKLGALASVQYDNEGKVVSSEQTEEILVDMEYPIPDTYGEFYLKTFCESDN